MRNVIGVGDRKISFDFNKLYFIGDLDITDNNFNTIKFIGDMILNNSKGKRISSIGNLNLTNANIESIKLIGEVVFNNNCYSKYISCVGQITIDTLECDFIKINKTPTRMKFNGSNNEKYEISNINISTKLIGETLLNIQSANFIGEFSFEQIYNQGYLKSINDIECEEFISCGVIDVPFLNSEIVYIYPLHENSINLIGGTNINITKKVPKNKYLTMDDLPTGEIMVVNEIEGDIINIEQTMVKSVSGIDVNIGELCIVDKVYYKNSIYINPKAVVKEIIKMN